MVASRDNKFGKINLDLSSRYNFDIPIEEEKGFPLVHIIEVSEEIDSLVVDDSIKENLYHMIKENNNYEKMLSYGLKPKQKILFCGPPGTGKTMTAKIISKIIGYPFVYVKFDTIISSLLGQTSTNLRKIFDFIELHKFVVLFDEFDIVGKTRDDEQEHGEIKRVVNNFIQLLDMYEGQSILVAATNHQHLLDIAIWRRFDDVLLFKLPNAEQRHKIFKKRLLPMKNEIEPILDTLVAKTINYSGADIVNICENALRRAIIAKRSIVIKKDILIALSDQKRRKNIMVKKSIVRKI